MPLISVDTDRYSQVVKFEFEPALAFCREAVVANEAGATTYAVGTVLGLVTATGKYKIAVQNAADGSQTPAAVVVEDTTLAANTDKRVLVLLRGPAIVSKSALKFNASFDTAPELAAAYAALAAKNILVNDTI